MVRRGFHPLLVDALPRHGVGDAYSALFALPVPWILSGFHFIWAGLFRDLDGPLGLDMAPPIHCYRWLRSLEGLEDTDVDMRDFH
jgi:hypothetical protein